jgi:hypothetical protein
VVGNYFHQISPASDRWSAAASHLPFDQSSCLWILIFLPGPANGSMLRYPLSLVGLTRRSSTDQGTSSSTENDFQMTFSTNSWSGSSLS